MDYEIIKQRLAPCGLHCGKCFAFAEGDIRKYSRQLQASLGNFDEYARRFVGLLDEPVFGNYPAFKELLAHLSDAGCKGCRNDVCKLFRDCKVRDCYKAKNVDFCFQGPEFPCNDTGFDQHLYNRFVAINKRMKETGAEKYYEEIRDKPRY